MNPNAIILKHPLIEHKLAILRAKDTSNPLLSGYKLNNCNWLQFTSF